MEVVMNKHSCAALLSLFALSVPAAVLAADEAPAKEVNAFKACYSTAKAKPGAPVLKLDVVVDSAPERKAVGMGTVNWGSLGPAFKPIKAQISGPWYFMCTMKSCSLRFDFSSAPGARGLKGMLVVPNWGVPGVLKYEFEGSHGEVEQKAAVCN